MDFLVLLGIIVLIGALFGAKSFGGTIRVGCGLLILLAIGIFVLILLFGESNSNENGSGKQSPTAKTLTATDTCLIYIEPDINSNSIGRLSVGQSFQVQNPSRYKYFYRIQDTLYVRKECLDK